MKHLHGLGYYSGRACGRIHFGIPGLSDLSDLVLVLNEYIPDELFELLHRKPAGVILIGHGRLSHLAIFLCSLGLVTVSLSPNDLCELSEGDSIVIDGTSGAATIGPLDESLCAQGQDNHKLLSTSHRDETGPLADTSLFTADGVEIMLCASIASARGAVEARRVGATSIGLLRSEFLFFSEGDPASFESSYRTIRTVVEAAQPAKVVVRLLDVGGEKIFRWVPSVEGSNALLGLRGARLYSHEAFKNIFRAQVMALEKIAEEFSISVLVPYVTTADEFASIKRQIASIVPINHLKIGTMLETPSICSDLSALSAQTNLVAIGTNDLMQCFFGADRSIEATSGYLDPYFPGFWRFLAYVGSKCRTAGLEVTVCGELPSYPFSLQLLIGLGFDKFSVSPLSIPLLKRSIHKISFTGAADLARTALATDSSTSFRNVLRQFAESTDNDVNQEQ